MPLSGPIRLDRARSMMHTQKQGGRLALPPELWRIRAGEWQREGEAQHARSNTPRRGRRQPAACQPAAPQATRGGAAGQDDAVLADRGRARRGAGRRQPGGAARAAFAAEATLAAARGTVLTPDTALDEALGDSDRLDHAAEQIRKVGVNLKQAVKVLNSTGQPPGDLPRLAEQAMRWAAQVDALSVDLWKRAISAIRPGGERGSAQNPRRLTPAQPGGRTVASGSRAPGPGRPVR